MKKKYLMLLSIFLIGCTTASLNNKVSNTSKVFNDLDGRRNLTNISHVYLGMTYSEVISIMGDKFNIGYKQDESTFRILEPITIKSPYRVEALKFKDNRYRVVYFYTKIQKSDGIISDDELTPLVFQDDKLIGKGKDYLFHLKNKERL